MSTRRNFLGFAGSGLFVLFRIDPLEAIQEPSRLPGGAAYPADFNAYLHIGAGGRVTGFAGKVELGQSVTTSFALMLGACPRIPQDRGNRANGTGT
jgi:hypothetical protein